MESTEAGKQGRKQPLPSAPGSGSGTGSQVLPRRVLGLYEAIEA